VLTYNNSIQTVPSNIVAGAFGFKAREFFEVHDEAEREAPQVSFPGADQPVTEAAPPAVDTAPPAADAAPQPPAEPGAPPTPPQT
jgi:LemA protein